jgi:hypothetical protein
MAHGTVEGEYSMKEEHDVMKTNELLKQLRERQSKKVNNKVPNKKNNNKAPRAEDYVETYGDGTKLYKFKSFIRDVAKHVDKKNQ